MTEFEGNAKFISLCNPPKSSVNVSLIKLLKKKSSHKKVIICFHNLSEERF